VEVWFQNRRARTKLKQTEVDCESLKRCCETLTEQNRRLQREVQELRALKLLAPPPPPPAHLYMRAQPPPPTTLTMCPSCERVAPSGGKPAVVESRPAPTGPWGPVQMLPVFVGRPAQRS
jgi:homeobox-leucine zipper protein